MGTLETARPSGFTRRALLGTVLVVGASATLPTAVAAATTAAADPPSEGNIVFWHIRTNDIARAVPFYQRMFGFAWTLQEVNAGTFIVVIGGAAVGAIIGNEPTPVTSNSLLYVFVSDLAKAIRQAERLCARVIQGPAQVTPGTGFVDMKDPTGNEFGMIGPWSGRSHT
jgi:predicted enzyme related to lactoylglutathione lyase